MNTQNGLTSTYVALLLTTFIVFAGMSVSLGEERATEDSDTGFSQNRITNWNDPQNDTQNSFVTNVVWNITETTVDITQIRETISSNLLVNLPVKENKTILLNLTALSWDADISFYDEEGNPSAIQGLTRLLQANETVYASFLSHDQGLTGTVYTNNTIIDYTSQGVTDEGVLLLKVAERANPTRTIPPAMNQALINCDEPEFNDPDVEDIKRRFCNTAVDTVEGVINSIAIAPGYPYDPPNPPRERVLVGNFPKIPGDNQYFGGCSRG